MSMSARQAMVVLRAESPDWEFRVRDGVVRARRKTTDVNLHTGWLFAGWYPEDIISEAEQIVEHRAND